MSAVREQVRMPLDGSRVERTREFERQQRNAEHAQRGKLFSRISLGVCCIASFAAVWTVAAEGANIDKLSYRNTDVQTKIQQQTAINASLSADVAQAKNPSTILANALKDHEKKKNPITLPGNSGK